MNAFSEARLIEAQSVKFLEPFLEERAFRGRFVLTLKGPLARALQSSAGDALFNVADGSLWSVEMKADNTDHHNMFLETFSNKNLNDASSHSGRGSTPGWMVTLGADLLLYHRLRFDELLVVNLFSLKRWAFGYQRPDGRPVAGRIFDYPERAQRKYGQPNDTWGRCVPISVIEAEVGLKRFSVQQLTLWSQGDLA